MKNGFTPIELITTLFMIAVIGFGIFVLIKYGNTPLEDMPVWVWFLLK